MSKNRDHRGKPLEAIRWSVPGTHTGMKKPPEMDGTCQDMQILTGLDRDNRQQIGAYVDLPKHGGPALGRQQGSNRISG